MKNKGTISHLTPELMEAYFNGSLDNASMHQVEKLMLESDFEAEAMEGLSMLTPSERNADLDELQKALKERTRRRSGFKWWQLAAAISILATVTFFLIQPPAETPVLTENSAPVSEESPVAADIPEKDTSDLIALNNEQPSTEKPTPERAAASESISPIISEAEEESKITADARVDSFEEETAITLLDAVPAEEMALSRAKRIPQPDSMEKPSVVILEKAETENSKVGRIAGEPLPINGQNGRTIHGRIIMQDGTPIPGVNVLIDGTNQGTISDMEGYYQIDVPNDASLVFSMLGMEQQQIARPSDEEINVTMEQDVATLSEVVVTGQNQPGLTIGANPSDGQAAFQEYIDENLRYPEEGKEGTVIVRVDISSDGTIEDMKIMRSLGEPYDSEAIRLIQEGPSWTPALKNGNPVADRVRVKIVFEKKD